MEIELKGRQNTFIVFTNVQVIAVELGKDVVNYTVRRQFTEENKFFNLELNLEKKEVQYMVNGNIIMHD